MIGVKLKIKYNVEKLNPYERKINITVPWEEVGKIRETVTAEIQKEAKLPGFRQGKIPVNLIKNKFKKEIEQETLHKSVELSFRQVVEESKIIPLTNPNIDGGVLKQDEPLTFVAQLEIRPEISLKDYKKIDVKRESVDIKEDEIDETLKYLQHQFMSFLPLVEGSEAKEGHFATIDFTGLMGGAPFQGNEGKGVFIEVGKNALIPGFETNLIGMKKGDKKSFDLKFPDNYNVKDLAGKDVTFSVTMNQLEEKIVPPIDEEFVKKVGEFKMLAGLREDVKAKLLLSKENEAKSKQKESILKELIKLNPFAVPPSLIQRERSLLWNHLASRLIKQGIKEDQLGEYTTKWESEIRELAIDKVKGNLILAEIAFKEGIKIEEKELKEEAKRISLTVESKDRDRLLKSQEFFDLLYMDLLRERVLNFLINEVDEK